ncbi:MAG: EI24 domain-containing protein [Bacteroidetes bacterium]|nr:EI24 domain-containing protein [Bacteroidota bacterium]
MQAKTKKPGFWRDFGLGFRCYGKAFKLLFTTPMGFAFLVPLTLMIVFIIGGWEVRGLLRDYIDNRLLDITNLEDAEGFWMEALAWTMQALIYIILGFLFFFIFAYFGGYIVVMVMSPVLALLSEKTEKKLTGNNYKFDIVQLMRDIIRGILIALRNLFIELGFMVAIFIGSFIPVLKWPIAAFGTFFLFFISAYFYGFSFMDYSIERRRLSVRESVKLVRKRKGVAIGNGFLFALILLIPVIGVMVSAFFAVVSSVAGTIAMNEIFEQEEQYRDIPKLNIKNNAIEKN